MEPHPHPKTANTACTLTFLMVGFTLLISGIGGICFLTTYIPLARHQVHGKHALLLYKVINITGIVLVPLPYVLDLILLLFFAILRCTRSTSKAPPRPSSDRSDANETEPNSSKAVFRSTGQMEWDDIAPPDYDYMNKLILAFVRERKERGVREEGELHHHQLQEVTIFK